MSDSILDSLKGLVDLEPDYNEFDQSLILLINGELAVLNQIGVGPAAGFHIEDASAVWDDLLEGEMRLNMVKTYLGLKVKLVFDPPPTSFVIAAMEKQAEMYLWRIHEYREEQTWVPQQSTPPSWIDS